MGSLVRRRKPPRSQHNLAAVRSAARSWAEQLEPRVLLSVADPVLAAPYLPPEHSIAATRGLLSRHTAGKPLNVALSYLKAHASALGIARNDLSNVLVTDQYTDADTGVTHIYLQQRVNGLKIAGANLSISLTRDNRVILAGGHFVRNAAAEVPKAKLSSLRAPLNADQALVHVAPTLGLDLGQSPTVQTGSINSAAVTLSETDASVAPIPASLQYFPTPTGLRLGWDMVLRTPDGNHWYDTHVDGVTGASLGTVDWAHPVAAPSGSDSAGVESSAPESAPADAVPAGPADVTATGESYDVYPLPFRSPDDGPRTTVTDPADPTFSPYGWHDTNGKPGPALTLTSGNNVNAYIDAADTGLPSFQPDGGPSLSFDPPLDFSKDPSANISAAVTQLFYVTNTLHDIHANYGFTEAAGNFQAFNYSGAGVGNDPLQAEAQDGGGLDNSNMFIPPDGQPPVMQMYLWDKTNPNRDGDFDNTIIIHEYGHGVSTRLTGGPSLGDGLFALQSASLGEGWSDWWALMLTQKPTDPQDGGYGIANYALGQAPSGLGGGADGPGIRRFPYSFSKAIDPLTFADYGQGGVEVHSAGTIWTTVLWDLNWLLIQKYGESPTVAHGYNPNVPGENGGNNLALKLVMDALKLQPPNPSFTDARDAIIAADQALDGGQDLLQLWSAFARRGLGYSAFDDNAGAGNVTAAFDLPPSLQSPRVVAQSPVGMQVAAVPSISFTFSKPMDPTSFSVADDVSSFTGPGGTDLKSTISGFSWLNGNTVLQVSFAAPSTTGRYVMTIGPQILSASGAVPMDQNANGIAGEAGVDSYAGGFGYNTQQLSVSSISPAGGSIVALPMTTLDVHFNEPLDSTSVSPFNLLPSRGTVNSATLIDSSTVRYALAGLNSEGPVTFTLPAGALKDTLKTDSAPFAASFTVDILTTPFPTPLFAESAAAPLVWERSTSATISTGGDVDSFTLNLDPGQTLAAIVSPKGSLRPSVDLLDSNGNLLSTATASAAGAEAVLQAAPISLAGTYTLRVSGAGATSGGYSLRAILNAALEGEQHAGPSNDTPATAQNLDSSFTSLGDGASRTAVVGQLSGAGTVIAGDDFSSGVLGSAWTTYSSDPPLGEIFIATIGNQNALLMDHNDLAGIRNNLNEAVWSVDPTGRTRATLSFGQTSFGDEQDTLPADFTGHGNGDGVAISDDNVHWHTVWNGVTTNAQGIFGSISIDLAAAAAQAGMVLGPNFKIKFQQYDNYYIPLDGRGYENIRITANDAPADYYSLDLNSGDSLSAQVTGLDIVGGEHLDLLDSTGQLLAAASGGAANADLTVSGFVAPTTGAYYLRVSGDTGGQYLLTVARNADLDIEPNDSTPQTIHVPAAPTTHTILGRLQSSADIDRYSISLTAGQPVIFATSTPGDGQGEPVNLLNPQLRLLSGSTVLAKDDNSAADGRNALLSFTPTTSGVYTIEVSATVSTFGDYVLSINGGAPAAGSFAATINKPRASSVAGSAPALIEVSLSQPVQFNSVSPNAVSIDGIPATSVTLLDGRTLSFGFTAGLPDGVHVVTLAGGSFTDLYGDAISPATASFSIQSVAPRVIASSIVEGASLSPGDVSYSVTFNQPMLAAAVDASAIRLAGLLRNATYTPASFSFNGDSTVLTINYKNLPEDNYTLTLVSGTGAFTDLAGNALDGEPAWPLPPSGSGDGKAGGDFFVHFSLDVTTASFPPSLAPQLPTSSLVYSGDVAGVINSSSDTDSYTIDLAAGQTAAIVVHPTSGNPTPTISLLGPGGTAIGSTVTAPAPGGDAVFQAVPIAGGAYTVVIGSAGGSGLFTAQLVLNAQIESESHGGPRNDTRASAQNLDPGFTPLDPVHAGRRAAVLGVTDSGVQEPDFYALTLGAGQRLTAGLHSPPNANIFLNLIDSAGAIRATGDGATDGFSSSIISYLVPASGVYYLQVFGEPNLAYDLLTITNAVYSNGRNTSTATAQSLAPLGEAIGSLAGPGNFQANYYTFSASEGNILSIGTATPGGPPGEFNNTLDPAVGLFDPKGNLVASDDNSAADHRNAQVNYVVPAGSDGAYTLEVYSAGGGGEYVVSVDGATPPPPAGAPDLAAATDSGLSATDNITNFNNATAAKALRFSVPNTVAGAQVQILANGLLIGAATATGTSTTVTTDGITSLPDGSYTVVAHQGFSDGTTLDSPALPLTIKTAVPNAPAAPTLDASTDSGVAGDGITNVAAPLVDIPTPLFWQVFQDGVAASKPFSQGRTFQAGTLSAGVHQFAITAMDVAGNVSSISPSLTLIIDRSPPTVAQVSAPPVTALHGVSYGFAVTYADNTAVDLTTLDGSDVIVTGPAGYKQPATLISATASGNSIVALYRVPAPSVGWTGVYAGTYKIVLQSKQVFDIAGNDALSAVIGSFAVQLPIEPTLAPVLSAASDHGLFNDDDLTNLNNASPTAALQFVVGDTAIGGTVTLYADGVLIGSSIASGVTTTVTTNGSFKLFNGVHHITARQTPLHGTQTADSPPLTVTILTASIATPPPPALLPVDDTGVSNTDGITNLNSLTFSAVATPYFRVISGGKTLTDDYVLGDAFTLNKLPDGAYDLRLIAEDAAGNQSAPSLPDHVVVDTRPPANVSAGSLDATFGTLGVLSRPADGADQIVAAAVQANGKIIAAGPGVNPLNGKALIKVVRYNPDGSVDPTFGAGGVVYTGLGTSFDLFHAIALQPDGKILLAGNGLTQWSVVRLTSTGLLDLGFGNSGRFLVNEPSGASLNAIAVQPNGAIVLGGQISGNFGLVRVTAAGSLDLSFNAIGSTIRGFAGNSSSSIASLAISPTGQIIAAGSAGSGSNANIALAALLPDGSLDPTFGKGGQVITPIGGSSSSQRIKVLADGKLMLAAIVNASQSQVGLVRYNANGTLDGSFGAGGIVNQGFMDSVAPADMVIAADGSLLVAGNDLSTANQSFVARFTAAGALDPIFGSAGSRFFAMGPQGGTVAALLLMADGSAMAAGSSNGDFGLPPDFALAHILTVGTYLRLDPASDSGTSNSDGITNVADPLLDMIGRGGNYYRVYSDGVLASGLYESSDTLTAPQGAITFTLVDAAGNESLPQANIPYVVDTSPPSVELTRGIRQITSATNTAYQVNVFFFDGIAFDPTSVGDGDVSLLGPNGFSSEGKLTSLQLDGSNRATAAFQFALPGGAWDGSNNGIYSVVLNDSSISDVAGNFNSSAKLLSLQVSVTAGVPQAPILSASTDTGSSSSDAITNFNNSSPALAPVFLVPGTVAGSTVTVYANGVAIRSAVASGFLTTVTADGKTAFADGTVNITARSSLDGGGQSADSPALALSIDTTPATVASVSVSPPTPINLPGTTPLTVTVNYTDGVGVSAASLSGTNLSLAGPGGISIPATLISVAGGGTTHCTVVYQITPPGGAWDGANDGTYHVLLGARQVSDTAGNFVAASILYTLVVNTSGAAPQSVALTPQTDSGISSNDQITNFNNSSAAKAPAFVVTGTLVGATVTLFLNGVPFASAVATSTTTTVTGDGKTTIANGSWTVTARQKPRGGVQSADSPDVVVQILAEVVPAPGIVALRSPAVADPTGTYLITAQSQPIITTAFSRQQNVRLYVNGIALPSNIFPPAGGGTVNVTLGNLDDGQYVITQTNVDIAGNESPTGPPLKIAVDTQPPKALVTRAPNITAPAPSYSFTVTYSDATAVAAGSIIVKIIDPDGNAFSASSVTKSLAGNAGVLTYTYTIDTSSWTSAKNGTYSIALNPLSDVIGNATPLVNIIATFTVSLPAPHAATVVGRHLFYNDSAFDGANPAANARDDAAIATDKKALLPGHTATFANYSSYTKGINGIMIDLTGLPSGAKLSAKDFLFRIGTSSNPSAWRAAPSPVTVVIRRHAGVGGSDRVELIFADRAITNTWLQVTVLANANTGLASRDVFYFGNLVGECGNSAAGAAVSVTDVNGARGRISVSPVGITNVYDYNRDGVIDMADVLAARANTSGVLSLLKAPSS